MSKQSKLNADFCTLIATKFADLKPIDLLRSLVQLGIITEKQILRFMAIWIYKKEIERTISARRKRGDCGLASHRTLERVPISERQLWEIRKSYGVWFSGLLF